MHAAKISLGIALAWIAFSSLASAQDWGSPLRHLPENTMAVAHVRVDAFVKSEWGKGALDEWLSKKERKDSFATLKTELGLDALEIETLTFLLLDPVLSDERDARPGRHYLLPRTPFAPPPPPVFNAPNVIPPQNTIPRGLNPTSAPVPASYVAVQGGNTDFLPLVIISTRKAIDRKQLMRKKQDLENSGNLSRMGVLFLSDHAVAVGPDYAVVHFAANTSDKESELGKQLILQNSQAMIQGGLRIAPPFKKALQADAGSAGPLAMVFPLINVTHATYTVDVGKPLEMRFRLQAAGERQANLVAQSAKTLLAMTEVGSEKFAAELEKTVREAADAQARNEAKDAVALTKALRQMAAGAQVDQRQSEVSIYLQLEISGRQVVPLLQDLFFMDANPRATLGQHK